jgi:FkbM family methyltransferase
MASLLVSLACRAIKTGISIPGEAQLGKYVDNAFLADLLKRLRINCVLDVGANRGQFAERLRLMGYEGHIFSFEPMPTEFALLEAASAGDSRWHCYNSALGRTEEIKQFNIVGTGEATVYSSFLAPRKEAAMPAVGAEVSMTVKMLDKLFPEIEAIAGAGARYFLKLDTQGFDLEVCAGATVTLPRMLGIQSEISVQPLYDGQPGYIESLAYYQNLGLALMNLSVVNRTAIGGVLEYDCLMARPEALAASHLSS